MLKQLDFLWRPPFYPLLLYFFFPRRTRLYSDPIMIFHLSSRYIEMGINISACDDSMMLFHLSSTYLKTRILMLAEHPTKIPFASRATGKPKGFARSAFFCGGREALSVLVLHKGLIATCILRGPVQAANEPPNVEYSQYSMVENSIHSAASGWSEIKVAPVVGQSAVRTKTVVSSFDAGVFAQQRAFRA